MVSKGGRTIQYRMDRDGTLSAWEERTVTHDEVMAAMAAEGFRLPTSDEWEYACGAGSRPFSAGASTPRPNTTAPGRYSPLTRNGAGSWKTWNSSWR